MRWKLFPTQIQASEMLIAPQIFSTTDNHLRPFASTFTQGVWLGLFQIWILNGFERSNLYYRTDGWMESSDASLN